MYDTFYIVANTTNDRFYLYLKDTHFCLSVSGDIEVVVKTLKHYVKKYRTRESFLLAVSLLDRGGFVSPSTVTRMEEVFLERGHVFDGLVKSTIDTAYAEVRQELKDRSPLKRTKKRLDKVRNTNEVKERKRPLPLTRKKEESPKEDTPNKVFKPRPLLKKRTLLTCM